MKDNNKIINALLEIIKLKWVHVEDDDRTEKIQFNIH